MAKARRASGGPGSRPRVWGRGAGAPASASEEALHAAKKCLLRPGVSLGAHAAKIGLGTGRDLGRPKCGTGPWRGRDCIRREKPVKLFRKKTRRSLCGRGLPTHLVRRPFTTDRETGVQRGVQTTAAWEDFFPPPLSVTRRSASGDRGGLLTPFTWPWRAPQARISLAEDPLGSGVAPGPKVGEEALEPRLPFTRVQLSRSRNWYPAPGPTDLGRRLRGQSCLRWGL